MTFSDFNSVKIVVTMRLMAKKPLHSVWEYIYFTTDRKLYAIYTEEIFCDIHERPYVTKPKRIWKDGYWLGDYAYLNVRT
jgi:hypothetical protein